MQPVIIEDTVAIAANTTEENVIVLNDSLRGLLQTPYPCRGGLIAVQSAGGLFMDLDHGSQNVVKSSEPRVSSNMEDPYDVIADNWYCQSGEQLVLRVANTSGGSLSFKYRIVLIPLVDESWTGGDIELPPDSHVMQRGPINIPNNTVDLQLLDGLTYERLPVPSMLRVLMTASAAGPTRQLYIEQQRIAPPSVVVAANRMPVDPLDSTIDNIEVPANSLQQLQISNYVGGDRDIFWKTINTDLVRR